MRVSCSAEGWGGRWGWEAGWSVTLSGLCFIDRKFFFRLSACARALMHGFHLAKINSQACTKAYTVSCVSVCVCAHVQVSVMSHQGRVGGLASSPCKKSHSTLTHFPSLTNGMVAILFPMARR